MFVVCQEHLDIAIDEFVDEYEDAPDLVDLEEVRFKAWEPPKQCERCGKPAKYLVV
jgi:CxxH/CxxC protein (TIGR04129 family)